ncbi:MAG TPA: hypothetical protein VK524_16470 [Polyangiaceae bacterium]|nr:hypothetical protein [Polyangiaceae bacterium]
MRRVCKLGALGGRMALAWAALLLLLATRCNADEYPLDPTFCDDWCRVLRRVDCDEEPENCVRTCEASLGPAACRDEHRELFACYERTPASEFACARSGFDEEARPAEYVCRNQRDALVGCAYPNVRECIDVCRSLEARYAQDAGEDLAEDRCPSRDLPCDSLCWVARGEIAVISRDAGERSEDADSAFGQTASVLITCALERAEACRLLHAIDAGTAVPENWSSVLLQCAGELRGQPPS